jgi:serine protease Do
MQMQVRGAKVKKAFVLIVLAIVLAGSAATAQARVTGLPDFTSLVESAGPAVVNIRVTQFGNRARPGGEDNQDRYHDEGEIPDFFRRFFDAPNDPRFGQPDRVGAGSGFIFESDGYIITNHHVIDGADQIIVRLADRREFEAELIGSDELSDIALLKIDAADLPTLEFGHSEELRQGEWVAAIGSPFNFEQSITAGIVSAKGRSNGAQQYVPFIQTDVAINRGNSGGPLLNMDGEVVGINSWILSSSGGYIGLSFSIPVEVAESTVRQLRETGTVQRGLLGVVVGAVTRELAEALNLDRPVGALVNDVTAGGSADRAGIEPGDVILAFNGRQVETWNDLPPLVGANPPGTEAEVLVSRSGEERVFEVVLDALPADGGATAADAAGGETRSNVLGLAVERIAGDQRRELGDPAGGVIITDVESDAAWRAGVRPGDVLLMINNRPVANLDSFEEIVGDIEPGKAVALRIWRNGATSFIAYTPQEGGGD